MSDNETIDFGSLAPIQVEVSMNGEEFILQEASGAVAKKFQNARLSKIKFVDGKPSSLSEVGDIEPYLVSLCLFRKSDKGLTSVKQSEVESWPYRIQEKLFLKAKQISGLDKTETPYQELIKEAFNHPDSPVTPDQVITWVNELQDPKFDPIKKLFEGDESKK